MKLYSKIKRAFRQGGFFLVLKRMRLKTREYYLWYFASQSPISYLSYFAHQMPKGLPSTEVVIKEMAVTEADVLLAERLLWSLNTALKDEAQHVKSGVDVWDIIKQEYHKDFFEILHSNDPRRVAEYLCNMHRHGLNYGISGDIVDYDTMVSSALARRRMGARTKDILVSFAEALGILPYEVLPTGKEGLNIYRDADELIDGIEKKLGIEIAPPEIDGALAKLKLKKGLFQERDFWSLYTAWRVSRLVPPGARLAEIGPGMGKVAWYASRFGFHDYAMFDLPLLNMVQGWYLVKALPGKKVVLYGEPMGSGDSIKVLPYWEFPKGARAYDLVLNVDSFPEIERGVVEDYLRKIKTVAPYLLSINQEKQILIAEGGDKRQLVVPEVIEKVGGFERMYRFPFWLRKAYVEELYKVSNP